MATLAQDRKCLKRMEPKRRPFATVVQIGRRKRLHRSREDRLVCRAIVVARERAVHKPHHAIAHKEPGYSIIGAGLVRPPMACFHGALRGFAAKYGLD